MKLRSSRERIVASPVFVLVGACAANLGVACEPLSFQTLDKLTPIAVEVSPPTANPGDRVALDLTLFDPKAPGADAMGGDAGVSTDDAELQVAWFGGCHNPPGESATGCLPLLAEAAAAGVELLAGGDPTDVDPALLSQLGFGPHFEMDIPDESVANRQRRPDLIPFGVSYAFFGVCRGTFTLVPEERERLPIGCVDEAENPVSEDDFLLGFTTVYVYDELQSQPPPVRGVALGDERVRRRECSIGADCDGLGDTLSYTCHEAACVPRVPTCQGDCESLSLAPIVDADVGELDPTSVKIGDPPKHELVWVKYYAVGALDRTESLVMDRDGSLRSGFAAQWTPPKSRGAVPLWTVVQDSRGGTTPMRVDVVVE